MLYVSVSNPLKAELLQNIIWNFSSYLTGNIVLSLTDSLWRRRSQQSPFNFLSHSLHVSAPTGHLQMRYTIRYFKDYFNTTDPLHVRNLIIGMLYVVHRYYINIKNCKIIEILRKKQYHIENVKIWLNYGYAMIYNQLLVFVSRSISIQEFRQATSNTTS
jgi:hypothetical protein